MHGHLSRKGDCSHTIHQPPSMASYINHPRACPGVLGKPTSHNRLIIPYQSSPTSTRARLYRSRQFQPPSHKRSICNCLVYLWFRTSKRHFQFANCEHVPARGHALQSEGSFWSSSMFQRNFEWSVLMQKVRVRDMKTWSVPLNI